MTLQELRLKNKLTIKEVAKTLNVVNSAICNYESGKRKINIEQVLILAKLYNATAEEIIQAQLNSCQFFR